jgi:hypothetical protein
MPATKWYLNLPRNFGRKQKPHAGTVINLTASAGGALAFAFNATVDWTVDYGLADGHEDYLPAGPTFAPAQSPRSYNKFVTALTVPMVTGRTYAVEARRTGHADQVRLTAQYETWQRVYLTVHYMNQRCLDIYNAILPKIQAAFAAANIEIKQRALGQCRRDEPFSVSDDPTLPHLYSTNTHPLGRAPCHVRAVIVNDLAEIKSLETKFEIDNTTVANAEHFVRISSRGDNHEILVYENDTLVFSDPPFTRSVTTIRATTTPIDVPAGCISPVAENPLLMREIDVDGDDALALLELASRPREGRTYKVRVVGRCRARRCAAGWGQAYKHTVDVELTLANDAENPVVWYSNRVWIGDSGRTLYVERPQLVLDVPAVESITFTLADQTINHDPGAAVRASDSRVSVVLPEPVVDALAAHEGTGSIRIKLVLLGTRAFGPDIEDEADHEFSVDGLTHVQHKAGAGVECAFTWPAYNLQIVGKTLLFARGSTPTISVEITASVQIPDDTWEVDEAGNKLEIDLSAHDDLAVAAEAMAAGRKVTFEGFLAGRQSLGGYSVTDQRHFVALTTRRLRDDWDDEVIEQRVFLAFCHEIGHALALTPRTFRNHRTNHDDPHPNYYTDDHGGQGPHCHRNAISVPSGAAYGRPDTSSGSIWSKPNDDSKLCIMYHAIAHTHMDDQFCADCLAHLKRCTARFG